jgi:predicted Holliday junction resolvase-like endonuclease
MELLHSDILLFKNDGKSEMANLLKDLDAYFEEAQVNDDQYYKEISKDSIDKLNKYVQSKIQEPFFQYFLELKHDTRPDLDMYVNGHFMSPVDYSAKTKEYKSNLRQYNKLEFSWGQSIQLARVNYIKVNGHINKFMILIGLSNKPEHTSTVSFPIQNVAQQLNRGDIIITPAGITHPYTIGSIINGVFKIVEAI